MKVEYFDVHCFGPTLVLFYLDFSELRAVLLKVGKLLFQILDIMYLSFRKIVGAAKISFLDLNICLYKCIKEPFY
jgi:hypothetical protein